jgi:hypothetical protein
MNAILLLLAATGATAAAPTHKLEKARVQHVDGVLTYEVEYATTTVNEWVFYAARLCDMPGQTKTESSLEPLGREASEIGVLQRPVWIARIPGRPDHTQSVSITYKVHADLYSRRLVELGPNEKPPHVPELDAKERKAALLSHGMIDLDDLKFKKWLADYKLKRGANERDLDFARRTFLTIKDSLRYEYKVVMDRATGAVCTHGKSDCAGLCAVFVAALRANDVPTRTLAGRWAKSSVPGGKLEGIEFHQWHVKAEFFAEGIGWVPVDMSRAVSQKEGAALKYFGDDRGDFIVFHVDSDFILDTIHDGPKPHEYLQTPYMWATGQGKFDDVKSKQNWQVKSSR